jgi:hypothetical protein
MALIVNVPSMSRRFVSDRSLQRPSANLIFRDHQFAVIRHRNIYGQGVLCPRLFRQVHLHGNFFRVLQHLISLKSSGVRISALRPHRPPQQHGRGFGSSRTTCLSWLTSSAVPLNLSFDRPRRLLSTTSLKRFCIPIPLIADVSTIR